MNTPQNIILHELIGLEVVIVDSKNKSSIGKKGTIINETRNTIVIRDNKGRHKTFAKDQCVFSFQFSNGEKVRVVGELLIGRPEDRIKKKFKPW